MRRRIHRTTGFTLVELTVAVMILMLLMMLAVPSMEGVLADRRLRRSLDEFNKIVREAQERSIAERRPYLIVWYDGKVGLRSEGLARGENPEHRDVGLNKTKNRQRHQPHDRRGENDLEQRETGRIFAPNRCGKHKIESSAIAPRRCVSIPHSALPG